MGSETGSLSSADYQRKLARYCQTGELEPLPGANDERLAVYRGLVWNIVQDTLSGAYPIAEFLLGEERWQKLISRFFIEHPSSSPELWRMPEALYNYAVETRYGKKEGLPFLDHLLLFEWKEIELHMAPDQEIPPGQQFVAAKDPGLDEVPVLNPVAEILQLSFPVFKAKTVEEASVEGSYFLLIYRHPELLTVKFIEISPFFAAVLALLAEKGATFREVLADVAELSNISLTDSHFDQTKLFVRALLDQQAILGTRVP